MPFRKKTTFRRKAKKTTIGPNGKFYKPSPNIPAFKTAKWIHQSIQIPLTGGVLTTMDMDNVRTYLHAIIGFHAASIKIRKVEVYNTYGAAEAKSYPGLTMEMLSLNQAATLGKEADTGLNTDPARIGYIWPYHEANHIFTQTENVNILTVTPSNGNQAICQIGLSFLNIVSTT